MQGFHEKMDCVQLYSHCCTDVRMHTCMYVHVHVYVYNIYIYIYIYTCVYIYIYIYVHIPYLCMYITTWKYIMLTLSRLRYLLMICLNSSASNGSRGPRPLARSLAVLFASTFYIETLQHVNQINHNNWAAVTSQQWDQRRQWMQLIVQMWH